MPWPHSPMLQVFLTSTYGWFGSAGVRGNMARTCPYSQTVVWLTNWEPTNIATSVSSGAKPTSGFNRSKPYGRSVPPTFPVTVTIFELHHRTVHLRSDHLLQTRRSHAHGYHENPTSSQQSR